MKKIALSILAISFGITVQSQDICESFAQLKDGAYLEYTDFDKKGKPQSKSTHSTTNISKDGGKATATIKVEITDLKKKNNTFTTEYGISCEDEIIAVDMMRFFDTSRMASFEDMEVKVDANTLNFPINGQVGDALNDGHITVKASSGGVTIMNMTMNITNRKIETEESITTSAGTFTCKKMTYDFDSKAGFIKVQGSAEQWFNEDQILVQSITTNKKGKELGKTQLTVLKL